MLSKYSSLEGIYEHLEDYTPKMRESLENGKEMAFLSQKLANIITDLEIEPISEEFFAEKLKNPEYINLLKKFEFKSLIPKGLQEVQEKKIQIVSKEITSWEEYNKFLTLLQNREDYFGIQIDIYQKIFLSAGEIVYIIDSKKLDCSELLEGIFEGKIRISTFDEKEIFTKIQKILFPIQKKDDLQDVLF